MVHLSMPCTRKLWDRLIDLLPTPFAGPLIHRCSGCPGGIARTIAQVVRQILFRSLPAVPEQGKWMKAFPMMKFLMIGLACHRLLPGIWVAVVKWNVDKGKAPVEPIVLAAAAAAGNEDKYEDPDWSMDFHAMNDKRAKGASVFFNSPETHYIVFVYCNVMEPIKYLTDIFLAAARRLNHPCSHPLLSSCVTDRLSPVHDVLQYFSALVAGRHSRCAILLGFENASDFAELAEKKPEVLNCFRRLVLAASASLYWRLHLVLKPWPWALVALGDSRLSQQAREAVCRQFLLVRYCCLNPGFGRKLKEKHKLASIQVMTSPRWGQFSAMWSEHLNLTIADIEFSHVRNCRRAQRATNSSLSWTSFCAWYINQEAVLNCYTCSAEDAMRRGVHGGPQQQQQQQQEQPALGSLEGGVREKPAFRRGWRPIDIFRQEWIAKKKPRGVRTNFCSRDAWNLVKEDFAALPDVEQGRFTIMAGSSFGVARQGRRSRAIAECGERQRHQQQQKQQVSPLPPIPAEGQQALPAPSPPCLCLAPPQCFRM